MSRHRPCQIQDYIYLFTKSIFFYKKNYRILSLNSRGLADVNGDGQMDFNEFSIACKLITNKLKGLELPKTLPPSMMTMIPGMPPQMIGQPNMAGMARAGTKMEFQFHEKKIFFFVKLEKKNSIYFTHFWHLYLLFSFLFLKKKKIQKQLFLHFNVPISIYFFPNF